MHCVDGEQVIDGEKPPSRTAVKGIDAMLNVLAQMDITDLFCGAGGGGLMVFANFLLEQYVQIFPNAQSREIERLESDLRTAKQDHEDACLRAQSKRTADCKRNKAIKADAIGRIERLIASLTGKTEDALDPTARERSVALEKLVVDLEAKVKAGTITAGSEVSDLLAAVHSVLEALPKPPASADSVPAAEVSSITAELEEIKKLLET